MSSTTKKRKHSELADISSTPSVVTTGTSSYGNLELPDIFSQLRLIDLGLSPIWKRLTEYRREFTINEKKCHHLLAKVQAVNHLLPKTDDSVANDQNRRSSVRLIEKAAQTRLSVTDAQDIRSTSVRLIEKAAHSHLALTKEKLAKYRTKLTQLSGIIRDLKVSIEREEMQIAAEQDKMRVLRYWGAPLAWTDLPNELVLTVLLYLGYVHQQKLIRVSNCWKHLISMKLDHIYVDATTLHPSYINKSGFLILQRAPRLAFTHELDRTLRRRTDDPTVTTTLPWKFNRQSVRQLTFNGLYFDLFTPASQSVVGLAASTFPALTQINLVQVVLDLPNDERNHRALANYFTPQSPGPAERRITLSNCIIPAFPDSPASRRGRRQTVTEEERILGGFHGCYLRISDITWSSLEEFSQFRDQGFLPLMEPAWPYPDRQTEWLARWAPCLNGHERLLTLLKKFEHRVYWIFQTATWNNVVVMCKEHGRFCDHLSLSFYKELSGQVRNLIAVNLLQLRPPGMEPPPVPFKFEKFHLRKGKCVRFGPV